MTASFFPWGDSFLQVIFYPLSDESYATQRAADRFDENDIEIDKDGLYFINLNLSYIFLSHTSHTFQYHLKFFLQMKKYLEIEQDLLIEENSENHYFCSFGQRFSTLTRYTH